jgi:hypothetical protein
LSHSIGDTDGAAAMPEIELNPLLNPVLNQHMGRWAEVYFTNPPEKRDEAVLQLLIQIAREAGVSEDATPQVAAAEENSSEDLREPAATLETGLQARPCPSCGAPVAAEQKYCGICGASMGRVALGNGAQTQHTHLNFTQPETLSPPPELAETGNDFAANEPREWELSGEAPKFLVEQGLPYRYRIYAGAAIAILIGVLGYREWHGMPNWPGASRNFPQTATTASEEPAKPRFPAASTSNNPPAAENHPPAAVQPADSKSPDTKADRLSEEKTPTQPPVEHAAAVDENQEAANTPATSASANLAAPSSARPSASALAKPSHSSAASSSTNGSEELAMAESYLGTKPGGARDSSEAAKWLWKALAKQNATAAVMLSDLYLKGDGVAKNCDQARLLLDASARKRTPGAAERIRNLQAFGCQ